MNFARIEERSPKALSAFNDWARTKSILRGWGHHVRTPVSSLLPFELLIGPLMVFFREQDIVFGYHITKRGRSMVIISRPDKNGSYKVVSRTIARVDPMAAYAIAFSSAFKFIEARINGLEDLPSATETILSDTSVLL